MEYIPFHCYLIYSQTSNDRYTDIIKMYRKRASLFSIMFYPIKFYPDMVHHTLVTVLTDMKGG